MFAQLVKGGKVVGIDYLPELVALSKKNVAKADQHFVDDGDVKHVHTSTAWLQPCEHRHQINCSFAACVPGTLIMMQGDGWKGSPEHGRL